MPIATDDPPTRDTLSPVWPDPAPDIVAGSGRKRHLARYIIPHSTNTRPNWMSVEESSGERASCTHGFRHPITHTSQRRPQCRPQVHLGAESGTRSRGKDTVHRGWTLLGSPNQSRCGSLRPARRISGTMVRSVVDPQSRPMRASGVMSTQSHTAMQRVRSTADARVPPRSARIPPTPEQLMYDGIAEPVARIAWHSLRNRCTGTGQATMHGASDGSAAVQLRQSRHATLRAVVCHARAAAQAIPHRLRCGLPMRTGCRH